VVLKLCKEKILGKKETVFLGKIVEDVDSENEFKRTLLKIHDNLPSEKEFKFKDQIGQFIKKLLETLNLFCIFKKICYVFPI